MKKKLSVLIFTDLDGTLLHRDTFAFDEIKNYIKNIISDKIYVIPNTSKTDKEILSFNQKLGEALPYITENGSAIKGLNLINKDLPKELILSKEKDELISIFEREVPEHLKIKCKWLSKMNKETQLKILGLPEDQLTNALDRKYTVPFIFNGNKSEINELSKILKSKGLTTQEGGRVINLGDKVNKAKAMQIFIRFFKKNNENIKTIAVGDNYNDLDMLKISDYPCLVFNDQFRLDQIFIDNLISTNKPSPEGWADVIKMAMEKISENE